LYWMRVDERQADRLGLAHQTFCIEGVGSHA
jgi:hypothetical protein